MALTLPPMRMKQLEDALNFERAWIAFAEWLNGVAAGRKPTPKPWPAGWMEPGRLVQ